MFLIILPQRREKGFYISNHFRELWQPNTVVVIVGGNRTKFFLLVANLLNFVLLSFSRNSSIFFSWRWN